MMRARCSCCRGIRGVDGVPRGAISRRRQLRDTVNQLTKTIVLAGPPKAGHAQIAHD